MVNWLMQHFPDSLYFMLTYSHSWFKQYDAECFDVYPVVFSISKPQRTTMVDAAFSCRGFWDNFGFHRTAVPACWGIVVQDLMTHRQGKMSQQAVHACLYIHLLHECQCLKWMRSRSYRLAGNSALYSNIPEQKRAETLPNKTSICCQG